MMRFCTLLLVCVLLGLPGCGSEGGAVSVRWRIVDLTTGDQWDPGDVQAANGDCCYYRDTQTNQCTAANAWEIQNDMRIVLADPSTGTVVTLAQPLPPFFCSLREKTTAFIVPPGTYAVSLTVTNIDGSGQAAPVALPSPSVREIIAGDVVNLDVIEIGVNPLPLPGPGSGVTF